jgi:hypothetical protein
MTLPLQSDIIMSKPGINPQREHRITMEIVVDAYNEEECAMAWYCHLEEHLAFPFEARVRHAMDASPLCRGERVTVTGLAHDELCRVNIFVQVRHQRREMVVPLAQLVPVGTNKRAQLAITDWHYWHDQGYSF